jgi:hypothetical protein
LSWLDREDGVNRHHRERGFVVSTEVMLIAIVLVVGIITGWVKLRDQSLSELADTIAAIDAYILGTATLHQIEGTRWITAGAVVDPAPTGPVTETWNGDPAPAAELTSSNPDIYQKKDGLLVYAGAPGGE